MSENKSFHQFLNDILAARGLTVEKMAELTGIPGKHLAALSDGDFNKLPAVPYTRGYVIKIAEVLEINGGELWRAHKDEIISGINISDKLPFNRFAAKTFFSRKKIIIAIAVVLFIIYSVWRADDLLGIPNIEIISPAEDNLMTESPFIELSGRISNPRDKLLIDGKETPVESDGGFRDEKWLQLGVNVIEFRVKRFLGKETAVSRRVIFNPQDSKGAVNENQ